MSDRGSKYRSMLLLYSIMWTCTCRAIVCDHSYWCPFPVYLVARLYSLTQMNFVYDLFLPYLDYPYHTLLKAVSSWCFFSSLSHILCPILIIGWVSIVEDAHCLVKAHLAQLSLSLVHKWRWIHQNFCIIFIWGRVTLSI